MRERKPGKGNEEIESFRLLVGAARAGTGRSGTEISVVYGAPRKRMCQRLSKHPKLGVHSMMAEEGHPRVDRAHRSSNSVAQSTDAASWMPRAMHTPLQLPLLCLIPLPHLKASSEKLQVGVEQARRKDLRT